MKAVVAAFNQEKALVGAFSVITNLRMELSEALVDLHLVTLAEQEAQGEPPRPKDPDASDGGQLEDALDTLGAGRLGVIGVRLQQHEQHHRHHREEHVGAHLQHVIMSLVHVLLLLEPTLHRLRAPFMVDGEPILTGR